jgi:hypothetical protein
MDRLAPPIRARGKMGVKLSPVTLGVRWGQSNTNVSYNAVLFTDPLRRDNRPQASARLRHTTVMYSIVVCHSASSSSGVSHLSGPARYLPTIEAAPPPSIACLPPSPNLLLPSVMAIVAPLTTPTPNSMPPSSPSTATALPTPQPHSATALGNTVETPPGRPTTMTDRVPCMGSRPRATGRDIDFPLI